MTRVGIITQARMTSTRLPGKVLMEAAGKTMLAHHVERLRTSGYPVYVATTVNETDEPIVAAAAALGAPVFRGSEHDVLSRFAGAAREFKLDVVVRVTSDCPLIDGALVRRGIDAFLSSEADYVSNVVVRTYPRGLDFEVFSADSLALADSEATDASDREHVTPYVRRRAKNMLDVTHDGDASRYRITLDTPEDFEVIQALIEHFDADEHDSTAIIELLDDHPEIVALNAAIEQKKA